MEKAKVWREDVVIPTYEIGEAEKAPVFLEKRVYQGSSGVVYPYPVIEKVADEKHDKVYHAVYLENKYIKVMILPELGGRVQMAYDKLKKRHFVYYNEVVKPALVGLTGPWISGGIEFNWPQHHRPSTFLPVDSQIEEHEDGSATVWINEMEQMFHQKGMAAFTLYPDKAYIEIKGYLYNRTSFPQTFLWWANPAVAVNDYYQSVFPPDVNAVYDHGRRDVSTFPIATGTYYKVDYSKGVDISRYKNIPVPTSYMAVESKYDFLGGYENDTEAGMLHVANHHVSPGKKQWTWGNGDFGKAWDRNLTDVNGPYIELMAGVFTDNQPDFTWLQPCEEKRFVQYFLPYRELGVVKNATQDLLLNMEAVSEYQVSVKIFSTSEQNIRVKVYYESGEILYDAKQNVSPEHIFQCTLDEKGDYKNLKIELLSLEGQILLSYQPEEDVKQSVPNPAAPAKLPQEITSISQLFLTGQHIEQYRHATYDATDYYREALRREPDDVLCNNAMGLWSLRHGLFVEAESYLRRAFKTQTERNSNPYDGEILFNLGMSLFYQKRYDEAYNAFYKSCWNAAWQAAGYFACAQLSTRAERLSDALEEVLHSLSCNTHNHRARHLAAVLFRLTGEQAKARKMIEESLEMDRFNYGCLYEKYLLDREEQSLKKMHDLMRGSAANYDETALDYLQAGLSKEATSLWNEAIKYGYTTPMTYYYKAWGLKDNLNESLDTLKIAENQSSDYCFPNRVEAIQALEYAKQNMTSGARAPYYLGCLWYDKRQYKAAMDNWELSAQLNPLFPTVWRNMALGNYNKRHDAHLALEQMKCAFELNVQDGRIFMEYDQLRKRCGVAINERLSLFEEHKELIDKRDDLYLEYVTLLNLSKRFEEAKQLLDARHFHPWEGGEGKVTAQYQLSRMELAKLAMQQKDAQRAIALLKECLICPPNLGEGKLAGAQDNDFNYYLGEAYRIAGDMENAHKHWILAAQGNMQPAAAIYYNDQKPEKIFYQGLALLSLGNVSAADQQFNRLKLYGEEHLEDTIKIDYFAVSLPDLLIWDDDLTRRNRIHCQFLMALGIAGQGEIKKALEIVNNILKQDVCHLGVFALKSHLEIIKN